MFNIKLSRQKFIWIFVIILIVQSSLWLHLGYDVESKTKRDRGRKLPTISNTTTSKSIKTNAPILDPAPPELNEICFGNSSYRSGYGMKRPRIYIYDLPKKFNVDILRCLRRKDPKKSCYTTNNCGYGSEVKTSSSRGLTTHHTWQFSLEILMHKRLLASSHRVLDPGEADLFYVPYYSGLDCFCHMGDSSVAKLVSNIKDLAHSLKAQENFLSGKTHVMTLGKIEREHFTPRCPLLTFPEFRDFTLIGIEQEINMEHRRLKRNTTKDIVVAPYPSYGHLTHNHTSYVENLYRDARPVFVFLAAATRRSNHLRAQILDNFPSNVRSTSSFDAFIKQHGKYPNTTVNTVDNATIDKAWLLTPECSGQHHVHTLSWMRHSTFCLQPPGDSPTRKSFYDAIVSGCIPVLFQESNSKVIYPFENTIKYGDFTVNIDPKVVKSAVGNFFNVLKGISQEEIVNMQRKLREYLPYLQYSVVTRSNRIEQKDAVYKIMQELATRLLTTY